MEKMPLKKLTGVKIFNSVIKGKMTLRQLAENYDCSFEQFLVEAKKLVGAVDWKKALQASKRNEGKKEGTTMKFKTTPYPPQTKEAKKKVLEDELAIVQEKARISRVVTEDFENRFAESTKVEAEAKRAWEEAKKNLDWVSEQLESSRKADARYEERIRQIQNKLDEFNVYLVAPGYKGEMPKGKLVVVSPIEGYNVTVEKGDDLLNEVSFANMLELGFETLKEADTALEFAKLVLKYQVECEDEFVILVDDERIITILRGQEVDI